MFVSRSQLTAGALLTGLLCAGATQAADQLFVLRGYSDQEVLRMNTDGSAAVALPLQLDLANRVRVLGDRLWVVDSGAAELLGLSLADALVWQPGDPEPAVIHVPTSQQPGANPWDVIQLADGRLAVSNLNAGSVSLLENEQLQQEIVLPFASPQALLEQPGRLLISDSGFGSGTRLMVLDLASLALSDVPTLENPQDLLALPDRLDVLCSGNWFGGEAFVLGLDPLSLAPLDTLRLGGHAANLAWDGNHSVYSGDVWNFPQPGVYRYDSIGREVTHDDSNVLGPGGGYPVFGEQGLFTCGPTEIYRLSPAGEVLDSLAIGADVAHFCLWRSPGVPRLSVQFRGAGLHFSWTGEGWSRWKLWRQDIGNSAPVLLAECDTTAYFMPLGAGDTGARFTVSGFQRDSAPAGVRESGGRSR